MRSIFQKRCHVVETEARKGKRYGLFKARRTILIDMKKKGIYSNASISRQAPAAKFNWTPKKRSWSENSSVPNSRIENQSNLIFFAASFFNRKGRKKKKKAGKAPVVLINNYFDREREREKQFFTNLKNYLNLN